MPLPAAADQVVIQGYLLDEVTGLGDIGQISSEPVPLTGQHPTRPLLLARDSHTMIRTGPRTTTARPSDGYWALLALSTNDPDLDAYGGRKITLPDGSSRTIQVPFDAPLVTVSLAMAEQIGTLNAGAQVRALWYDLAAGFVTPTPPTAYYTASQTDSKLADVIGLINTGPAVAPVIASVDGLQDALDSKLGSSALGTLLVGSGIDITGTTDSATALQSLITAAGEGAVLIAPRGAKYLVGSQLALRTGQTLRAHGATFKAAAALGSTAMITNAQTGGAVATNGSLTAGANNITVLGGIYDGNSANRGLSNDPNAYCLVFAWTRGVVVRDTTVLNSPGNGIGLYNCHEVLIDGNNVRNSSANGILCIQSCRDVRISNNNVRSTAYQNHIFMLAQSGQASKNVTIIGNTCADSADFGIEVGQPIADGGNPHENITVTGNTVSGTLNAGISFRTVRRGTISANTVTEYGTSDSVYGSDGLFIVGDAMYCEDLVITGNTIARTTTTGSGSNGINITGVRRATVAANTIKGARYHGIRIESDPTAASTDYPAGQRLVSDFVLAANVIDSPVLCGISVGGTSPTNVTVQGNYVKNAGDTGIAMSPASGRFAGVLLSGNHVSGSTKSAVLVYAADDVVVSSLVGRGYGTNIANDDNRAALSLIGVNGAIVSGVRGNGFYLLNVHDSQNITGGLNSGATNGNRTYSNTAVTLA